MQIRFFIKVSLLILLISFVPVFSHAQDSWYADDSAPIGKVGLVWVEDVLRGNGLTNAIIPAENLICKSVDDSLCMGSKIPTQVEIILPPCSTLITESCVDGFQVGRITNNLNVLTGGKLVRTIQGDTFPSSPRTSIPAGGTIGIWDVPGENHSGGNSQYSVAARLTYLVSGNNAVFQGFQASVVPFRVKDSAQAMRMEMAVVTDGPNKFIVHNYHVGDCIWQEPGKCAIAVDWQKGAIANLRLRVPNYVTGWLYGRLTNPTIDVKTFSKNQNILSIIAEPVTVQASKPLVDFNNIPKNLLDVLTDYGRNPLRNYGPYVNGGYVWQIPSDTPDFAWFTQWEPYTNQKADALIDYWNIKSVPTYDTIENKCLKSSTNLIGLVTSNSLWYDGKAPNFDGRSLNYKVASLHNNPDGTVFGGSYDLVMRSDAARCLYGFSSAPVNATISVISESGSSRIATSVIGEKNGWLSLSAKGFTFSNPLIQVKLTQDIPKPMPTASPSASPGKIESSPATSSPIATNKPVVKMKTITCTKGKLIKKITSSNPICPKGYKKQ